MATEPEYFSENGAVGIKLNQWLKFLLRRIPVIGRGLGQLDTGAALVWFTEGGGGGGVGNRPFTVYVAVNEEGEKVLRVVEDSTLRRDIHPTSGLSITDLTTDIPLPEGEGAFNIWLEVDITGNYADPATPPLAKIDSGETWDYGGKTFWPSPIEFNTTDGTMTGGAEIPEEALRQNKFYVPIAHLGSGASAEARGVKLGTKWLVQLASNHLILGRACVNGYQCDYVVTDPSSQIPDLT